MTSCKVVVSAVALFASVAACSGGSGSSSLPFPASRDTPPNLRDLFGGREDPGTPREDPGSDRQTPSGSQGPGDSACPACDQSYACLVTSGGSSTHLELTLETTSHGCSIRDQAATFLCDGTIEPNGDGPSIAWHPYGAGGFAANPKGASLTCVPDPSHQGGGGNGTSSNGGSSAPVSGDTPSTPTSPGNGNTGP